MTLLLLVFSLLLLASRADDKDDSALRAKAAELHARSILVDTHNDITGAMTDAGYDLAEPSQGVYHTDLSRLQTGGVSALFFSIFIEPGKFATNGATARALKIIDQVYKAAAAYPDKLMFATSVADIRRAKKEGRIAALMGIEGGYAIENSLETLRAFQRLGVRYMTLTHTRTTGWAGAATKGPGTGLTEFGREVVREMNRIGMLVDVSHVSDATLNDVLDVAQVPVIASHSSARALCDVPRNIPDELLRRIAKNGGVVMVNFYNAFLDHDYWTAFKKMEPELDALWAKYEKDPRAGRIAEQKLTASLPTVPLSRLVDHIDHIVKVAGIDHVGIGSDFDGIERAPKGMEDVSQFPNLTFELLRRGYSESDVQKILGENFLRVFAAAEAFADRGVKAAPAVVPPRLAELDSFWSEVQRSVREGDYEGYAATCHEIGVIVRGAAQTSEPLANALAKWKQGFLDTRAGKMKANVQFRFSERLGDETTAHETGIFHYSTEMPDGKRADHYVHFEALLVKADRWTIMMEYQKGPATLAEWDRLK